MPKLKTLKPRIQTLGSQVRPLQSRDYSRGRTVGKRLDGRRLTELRYRMWLDDPHCTACSQLTRYPNGFELDHIVALVNGGSDTRDNRQLLCLDCHRAKTREDLG